MIIFDESKHAEDIIINGYKNKKNVNIDNIILVKYWKSKGLDEQSIRKLLKNMMKEYQYLFNRNILDYKVNRAIKIGIKYDLRTGIVVNITDKEIEMIRSLDKIELQKMMFVLLVVWKFNGKPQRFKINNVDLMNLSKVWVNNNTFWKYIYMLTQSKMLSMVEYKNKSYYKVHIDCDGDSAIQISNYDNLVYNYLVLLEPERFTECEKCGVLIKITSNRIKYCRKCWRNKEKNLRKNINKRYYNKIKTV